ncbi:group-specific protein [Heyndrickxia faecalis]|uniref:group-specific protein n=1 Tax=Heyndrickxia TaxID=2837504 RepID=UPI002F3AA7F6
MFTIQIDEKLVEQKFDEELKRRLDRIQDNRTFWDMKELCRQTCLSENTIKERFFYDKRFPKFKVGGKWLFPAKEAEEFLIKWLHEQAKN